MSHGKGNYNRALLPLVERAFFPAFGARFGSEFPL
jgi:hypothetical protein